MRWLGVDHGMRRMGLAVSDTGGAIASPLDVIPAAPAADVFRRIAERAREYGAEGIVVGWPLNMDDSEGPQGKLARQFAVELADVTGLDVRLWDERLSSMVADERLARTFTRKKKKARHDAVAAAVILQDFLASGGDSSAPRPEEAQPPK